MSPELDAPTSIATGVVAVGGVALAAPRLDDRTAPMAGLVATFSFSRASLTMNFRVAAEPTSGHLLGEARWPPCLWTAGAVPHHARLRRGSWPTAASPRSAPTSP